MIGEDLDKAADAAFQRYSLLLNAFSGLFAKAIAAGGLPNAKTLADLQKAAYAEAKTWLDAERQVIIDTIDSFGEFGVRGLEDETGAPNDDLSKSILDHLESLAEALDMQMRLQVERDIAIMGDALRMVSLSKRLGRGVGASKNAGASGAAADAALSRLAFEFVDRANRRWPSARHVRTLWRMYLVMAHAEATILRADEIGLDTLLVMHPDHSHNSYAKELDLVSEDFDASWHDTKVEVFHPNSHAWLSAPLEE